MIRNTRAADADAILTMIKDSGQFDDEGIEHVRGTLGDHLVHNGPAIWLTADDGQPVGVAYCAPEPVASGTWNLLMLWTRADRSRAGHGSALVAHLENELRRRGARLLIVETSGLADFAPARAFYATCGFNHEATVRSFFAVGDDKLVFTKHMAKGAA